MVKGKHYLYIFLGMALAGCIQFDHNLDEQVPQSQSALFPPPVIGQVKLVGDFTDANGDFIQVIGSNLGSVNGGRLEGPGIDVPLVVGSRSENTASFFSATPLSLSVETAYYLTVSNASAQAATPITIIIPNDTITEPHILDGEVKTGFRPWCPSRPCCSRWRCS